MTKETCRSEIRFRICLFLIFSVIIILSMLGCNMNTACLRSVNTKVPVLLSSTDRIGMSETSCCTDIAKQSHTPICLRVQSGIDLLVSHDDWIEFVRRTPHDFDALLAAATSVDDQDLNVCIDSLAASCYSLYFFFGLTDRTNIKVKAHVERTSEKGNE